MGTSENGVRTDRETLWQFYASVPDVRKRSVAAGKYHPLLDRLVYYVTRVSAYIILHYNYIKIYFLIVNTIINEYYKHYICTFFYLSFLFFFFRIVVVVNTMPVADNRSFYTHETSRKYNRDVPVCRMPHTHTGTKFSIIR